MGESRRLYNDDNAQLENESLFSEEEKQKFLNSNLEINTSSLTKKSSTSNKSESYGVLIVDDEKDIHGITKLNLENFTLNKKGLHFYHAYSAEEAKSILTKETDIALIFLDVVMETANAGLELVIYIREVLKNNLTQIVLNTGQPGIAPEKEVIAKYNINYYQRKAEFTENKLFTVTASSLRTYSALKENKEYSTNLEKIVSERTEKLKLALNTKDRLFEIIAHDLRNPFHTILGFSSLLQEHIVKFDKVLITKFAKTIDTSARQIFNLLTNLLDWASSQNENIDVSIEKFNLNDLINKNVNLHENNAKLKSNNIKFKPENTIYVNGDEHLVDTIVRNLMSNAMKYTERGIITISTSVTKDYCKMSIQDTGLGIDDEKIEFLKTNQLVSSTRGTQKEKGTGLGLIICKEFITLNKGEFFIESEINKGSTFSFTLPLAK